MQNEYKFQSQTIINAMPFGITMPCQIARSEVPAMLQHIHEKSKKQTFISTFVYARINQVDGWTVASAIKELKDIESDIFQILLRSLPQEEESNDTKTENPTPSCPPDLLQPDKGGE